MDAKSDTEMSAGRPAGTWWANVGTLWMNLAIPYIVFLCTGAALCRVAHPYRAALDFADNPAAQPSLILQNLWLLIVASAVAGLVAAIPNTSRTIARALCGALAGAALTALCGVHVQLLHLAFIVPVFILIAASLQNLRPNALPTRITSFMKSELVAGALLCLIVAVAGYLRNDMLFAVLRRKLEDDAVDYVGLASIPLTYKTAYREPLFIWILHTLAALCRVPVNATSCRLITAALGVGAVAVLFAFARRWFGLIAATVAASIYAISAFMVYGSVRLLREDCIIALFIMFLWTAYWLWGRRPRAVDYLLLGLVAALSVLIRMNSHIALTASILIIYGWNAFQHKVPPKQWWLPIAAIIVMWLPTVPYLLYCRHAEPDMFYAITKDIRFYKNFEFAGQPGGLTREEFQKDANQGPLISMGEYLFKYHTVSQVSKGMFAGIGRLYFGDLAATAYRTVWASRGSTPILYWWHFLGLAALLLPGRRLLFALLFLFHAGVFFLLSFPFVEPRIATSAYVGFYVGCGCAVATAFELISKQRTAAKRSKTSPRISPGGGQKPRRSAAAGKRPRRTSV